VVGSVVVVLVATVVAGLPRAAMALNVTDPYWPLAATLKKSPKKTTFGAYTITVLPGKVAEFPPGAAGPWLRYLMFLALARWRRKGPPRWALSPITRRASSPGLWDLAFCVGSALSYHGKSA
jgi:hypothetical protein